MYIYIYTHVYLYLYIHTYILVQILIDLIILNTVDHSRDEYNIYDDISENDHTHPMSTRNR
jgi:hypothetical protein